MFSYWILFSAYATGALNVGRAGRLRAGATWALGAVLLFTALMIGLRYQVGADWFNYERIFDESRRMSFASALQSSDPGFSLLNLAVARLGAGIITVNVVCAAIFCWGLRMFLRGEPSPWLAGLVAVPYLIIVVSMGYTRQGVAIGFILAAIASFNQGRRFKMIILIILAAAFHKSAVVVLPLLALAAPRNRLVTALVLAVAGALLYYLFVSAQIEQLMTNYVEAQYNSQGAWIRVGMNLPPALLFLLLQRRFVASKQERLLWRNFSLASLGALLLLLTTTSSTAVDRISLYLIPLQMFVIGRLPHALATGPQSYRQLILAVIIYSAAIQAVWLNLAVHAAAWLPYQAYPFGEDLKNPYDLLDGAHLHLPQHDMAGPRLA